MRTSKPSVSIDDSIELFNRSHAVQVNGYTGSFSSSKFLTVSRSSLRGRGIARIHEIDLLELQIANGGAGVVESNSKTILVRLFGDPYIERGMISLRRAD